MIETTLGILLIAALFVWRKRSKDQRSTKPTAGWQEAHSASADSSMSICHHVIHDDGGYSTIRVRHRPTE